MYFPPFAWSFWYYRTLELEKLCMRIIYIFIGAQQCKHYLCIMTLFSIMLDC